MEDGLTCHTELVDGPEVGRRVVVAVEVREVRSGEVQTDPVPLSEPDPRGMEPDRKLVMGMKGCRSPTPSGLTPDSSRSLP